MNPRQLLEENLQLIDRIAGRACRRVGVPASEVADVASTVKLALVENDYAILRRWEGRASLATYLAIVVQRLLADQRERTHGRWRASAEAQRLGERAVLVEDVIGRQRRSIDEAMPLLRAADASITRDEVVAIAERLPQRTPRLREVELPPEDVVPLAAHDRTDTVVYDGELRDLSRRVGALLRETLDGWPADDRLLMRLRFQSSLTVADIARMMDVPQRPLYRRIESLLARLRQVLLAAGIDPSTADDLLGASRRLDLDFGLQWENGEMHRTKQETGSADLEEQR